MTGSDKPLLMVFPMDLASHYLRCIALSKRLEPTFRVEMADSSAYRHFIAEARHGTFKAAQFDHEKIKNAAAGFDFSWLNERELAEIYQSQVEAIREKRPYAVLGDTVFTLKMAAEKTNVRFISLLNGYMAKYYALWRGVPKSHYGHKFANKVPSSLFEIIAKEMEYRALKDVHRPLRRLRQVEKLRPTDYLLDELEGEINLVCDLPDLFPLRQAPPSYRHIGPLFHSGGSEESDVLHFMEGSTRNVLVTMGSSGGWEKLTFLEDDRFKKYKFVLSGDSEGKVNPPNSISKSFINHTRILPRIDLVICHGGNGTIYQSLSQGVPVLCLPANFECEWNSYRVQAKGFGEVVEDQWSVDEIESRMDSLIKKRGNLEFQRISQEIASYLNLPIEIHSALQPSY